jgi:hypothetical protein
MVAPDQPATGLAAANSDQASIKRGHFSMGFGVLATTRVSVGPVHSKSLSIGLAVAIENGAFDREHIALDTAPSKAMKVPSVLLATLASLESLHFRSQSQAVF